MPDIVRSIVRPRLKDLEDGCIKIMLDDCDFQERFELYGDEKIDKPDWIKWKNELQEEYDRRRGYGTAKMESEEKGV